MSKLIDLNDLSGPFSAIADAAADYNTNQKEYYVDKEFFDIDPVSAKEYNRRVSELANYTKYSENYHDMSDVHNRIKVFASLSYALRKSGEAEAWASYLYNTSHTHLEEAEAIAALDDFPDYITKSADEGKETKITDKTRQWYIQKSPRVIRASKKQAMAEAMQKSFYIYRLQFTKALDTIKAFSYSHTDSSKISSYDNNNPEV